MGDLELSAVAGRLDRLPASRTIWGLVALLSFGAFFEIYDVSLTGVIAPGLVKAGLFHKGAKGLLGVDDQASFVAATFLGLWLGALTFSGIADRVGRKPIFALSLIWYAAATAVMGVTSSVVGIDIWRLLAGLGIGMQLVAIDCYLAELMPRAVRGRAFAVSAILQFLAVPFAALLALVLIPHGLLGIDGWRWLAWFPLVGALLIGWVQRGLPESPRWLMDHERSAEAEVIVRQLEARIARETGAPLPDLAEPAGLAAAATSKPPTGLWRPPYRGRVAMMVAFNMLQAIGYFGFANWVPTLLEARGVGVTRSLAYTAAIALSYPIAPMLAFLLADRLQRKWQIVVGALAAAAFGLLFAAQSAAIGWIVLGVLLASANMLMSIGFHAYQSELFPTHMRARAVGLVYSFSRLAAIFSGYLIAVLLRSSGVTGVFTAIAGMLIAAALVIGAFGPKTRGLALETIAPT